LKVNDIRNPGLRLWVEKHVQDLVAARRSAKRGTDDLRDSWSAMNEPDWEARRELDELRPRAREAHGQERIDREVCDLIESLPRIQQNGVTYRAPYSLGLEVAALRKLLGVGRPTRTVTLELVT